MAVMVLDPYVEEQMLAERAGSDGDQYDEVWEGVYIVTPLPNDEHQEIVSATGFDSSGSHRLARAWQGSSRRESQRPGRRLEAELPRARRGRVSPRHEGRQLRHALAGAADFLVEIISPGERTREKIPFYSSLGVVELLIVDRDPWTLELYRQQNGQLEKDRPIHPRRARGSRQPNGRPDVPTPPRRATAADPGDAPGHRAAVGDLTQRSDQGKTDRHAVLVRFFNLFL